MEGITYSTDEVALLAGVSYRQMDYWLRTGKVAPDTDNKPGSGYARSFTEEQVALICTTVSRWREAQAVVDDFRSGALWSAVIEEDERYDQHR